MRALSTSAQTQLLHKHLKPVEESHSCFGLCALKRARLCECVRSEVRAPLVNTFPTVFLLVSSPDIQDNSSSLQCVNFMLWLKYHCALLSCYLAGGLITGRGEVSVHIHAQLQSLLKPVVKGLCLSVTSCGPISASALSKVEQI